MSVAKKPTKRVVKLELVGGQAKPGPGLASLGINMGQFIKDFNDQTRDRNGDVVPVVFTIMPNKSFTFALKTTPTPILIKKYAKIEKGSSNQKTQSSTLSKADLRKIAEYKIVDSNAASVEAMEKMILGTMKQMGVSLA